ELIDSELKRLGVAQKLPFAHEIDNSALTTQERKDVRNGSALQRAKTVLEIHKRVGGQDKSATAFEFEESEPDLTYLLSRDYLENAPTQSNSLSLLFKASNAISAAVLDGKSVDPSALESTLIQKIMGARLASAAEKSAGLPATVQQRLAALAPLLGSVFEDISLAQKTEPRDVLHPGVRVCFTGDASDLQGRPISRSELYQYCETIGITAVNNVTKTKCDVLVVAELGTQSRKARNAKEY